MILCVKLNLAKAPGLYEARNGLKTNNLMAKSFTTWVGVA